MLYNLLYPLAEYFSIFNVFRYITFRTAYAIITSMMIMLIFYAKSYTFTASILRTLAITSSRVSPSCNSSRSAV